jgi:hypothetical protein
MHTQGIAGGQAGQVNEWRAGRAAVLTGRDRCGGESGGSGGWGFS